MKLMPGQKKSTNDSHDVSTTSRRGDLEQLFDRFVGGSWPMLRGSDLFGGDAYFGARVLNPPIDISETDTAILIRSEIPGVDPKDLSITVSGDLLTLSGEKSESSEKQDENFFHSERRFGSFRRTVQLPSTVDADKVHAEYDNGVLTVTLKRKDGAAVKRIPVSSKK